MRRTKDRVAARKPNQVLIGAAIASFLISLGSLASLRLLNRGSQSAVDGSIGSPIEEPNTVPPNPTAAAQPHFTENIIVPGLTETGEQIMRTDAEEGRSPEGV